MAAFQGCASTAEIALSAATAKTVLQLVAAANHRVKILGFGVYFDGVSSTAAPVEVRLLRQSTAGTGGDALTPSKKDDSIADTLLTTFLKDIDSAEPTAGDVIKAVEVHPQSGYEYTAPYGGEVIIGGGDRIGIECTAPAIVNVRAWIDFEE